MTLLVAYQKNSLQDKRELKFVDVAYFAFKTVKEVGVISNENSAKV